MYKHILVATDGSPACAQAVGEAATIARAQGARLTALNVRALDLVHYPPWEDGTEQSPEEKAYRERTREDSDRALAEAVKAAAAQGCACETLSSESDLPWQAIADAAASRGCDLIVMAHHMRKGLQRLLGESQTQQVIARAAIPVLVIAAAGAA